MEKRYFDSLDDFRRFLDWKKPNRISSEFIGGNGEKVESVAFDKISYLKDVVTGLEYVRFQRQDKDSFKTIPMDEFISLNEHSIDGTVYMNYRIYFKEIS